MQDELHAGNGDAVAKRLVAGAVGGIRDIRPPIGEPLEPFAFERSQSANETGALHDAFVLADELVVHALVVCEPDGAHCLLVGRLTDEVGRVLMLTGALGAATSSSLNTSTAGERTHVIHPCEGI